MNPGHLSGPLYQTDFWGLVFLKCVCLLWTPVSLNKTRGHFWRLATCTHIQMLGTPPSVHRLGIISFPFLAASKENIYHMLRQVSFYSNTFPQGKQNKTPDAGSILKSWNSSNAKKSLDTLVRLFLSLSHHQSPARVFNRLPLTVLQRSQGTCHTQTETVLNLDALNIKTDAFRYCILYTQSKYS